MGSSRGEEVAAPTGTLFFVGDLYAEPMAMKKNSLSDEDGHFASLLAQLWDAYAAISRRQTEISADHVEMAKILGKITLAIRSPPTENFTLSDDTLLSAPQARYFVRCNNNNFRLYLKKMEGDGQAKRIRCGSREEWRIRLSDIKNWAKEKNRQTRSDDEMRAYIQARRS